MASLPNGYGFGEAPADIECAALLGFFPERGLRLSFLGTMTNSSARRNIISTMTTLGSPGDAWLSAAWMPLASAVMMSLQE